MAVKKQQEITFGSRTELIHNIITEFQSIRAKGFANNIKDVFVIEPVTQGYRWYLADDGDEDPRGFSVASKFIYDWMDSGNITTELEYALDSLSGFSGGEVLTNQ